MFAQIFKKHETCPALYKPETDSRVTRKILKLRDDIWNDDEITASAAITITHNLDNILRYIDSVDMELPRYGV